MSIVLLCVRPPGRPIDKLTNRHRMHSSPTPLHDRGTTSARRQLSRSINIRSTAAGRRKTDRTRRTGSWLSRLQNTPVFLLHRCAPIFLGFIRAKLSVSRNYHSVGRRLTDQSCCWRCCAAYFRAPIKSNQLSLRRATCMLKAATLWTTYRRIEICLMTVQCVLCGATTGSVRRVINSPRYFHYPPPSNQ